MIDSKSRVCYTKNILAELQKSEEDTMNYRSVKISEDARISKQSVLAGDVTIGRDSCVFYFYEIVVPQAKDKRFKPSLGVEEE